MSGIAILQLYDVRSLRTAVALCYVEAYSLSFVKSLEAFTLNSGIMNKDVCSVVSSDESITLFSIEPFNLACCHCA